MKLLIILPNSLTLEQEAQNGPQVFEPFSQQAGVGNLWIISPL